MLWLGWTPQTCEKYSFSHNNFKELFVIPGEIRGRSKIKISVMFFFRKLWIFKRLIKEKNIMDIFREAEESGKV